MLEGSILLPDVKGWVGGFDHCRSALISSRNSTTRPRILRSTAGLRTGWVFPGIRLPNASMRRELFALHLPNPERVRADYAVLAELSKGLSGGDPPRWRIVALLLDRPLCVSDLAAILDLRLSNLSNHLKLLRECGVLRCRDPLKFGQPLVMFRLRVCMARMGVGGGVGVVSDPYALHQSPNCGVTAPASRQHGAPGSALRKSASICEICG